MSRRERKPRTPTEPTHAPKPAAPGTQVRSKTRLWMFRLLAIVLAPALFFLLLELALGIAGFGYPTSFFLHKQSADRRLLVENDKFGWRFFGKDLARTPYPMSYPDPKPGGTVRVFVFGESAAAGDPQGEFAFSRILGVLLQARYPGVHFEIINTALAAIDSNVILPIARESAGLQGDLWIVYMGNNEVVGPYGAGTVFGPQTPPLPLIRASIALKGTRTGQWLDQLRSAPAHRPSGTNEEWGGMSMFVQNKVAQDDPRMPRVYDHFRSNLEDILRAGRQAGAGIILCTVGSNLKDCAPFASLHKPGLSETQLADWTAAFDKGVAAQEAGQFESAVDSFRLASQIDNNYAELHFRWGQCSLALGQDADALREFTLARDLDALRFRADSRLNGIIRETASSPGFRGIGLVDAAGMFASLSPRGIPGSELFYEHVHLNFTGNYLLARAVADQAAALLPESVRSRAAAGSEWLSAEQCATRLTWTPWNAFKSYGEIYYRLHQPPFTLQADHTVQLDRVRAAIDSLQPAIRPAAMRQDLAAVKQAAEASPDDWIIAKNLSVIQRLAGDIPGAADSMERVTRQLPLNADAWAEYGQVLLLARRYPDAVKVFDEMARLDNGSAGAWFGKGQALYQQGDIAGAAQAFNQAIALKPDFSLAHWWLGRALEKQGQAEFAQREYRRAIEYRPRTAESLNTLGRFCFDKGWFSEAMTNYQDAITLAPADAQAHLGLGMCLDTLGRHDEAGTQFQEAVRANPNLADARFQLGVALGRKGDDAGALSQFMEAVALNPGWLQARLNLGIALSRAHRDAEAAEQFRAALRISPNNPVALQRLKAAESPTPAPTP
ncbi:MAG: tetratricopeptide repeat protein [Verrucomicrobiota bacterium]